MKRKNVIIVSVIILALIVSAVGLAALLTGGFAVGRITNKVYNVQNVYDELWNLVNSEGRGTSTALTNSTPGAETAFELGVLDYIRIPECRAMLSNHTGTLRITIYTDESSFGKTDGRPGEQYVVYEYDCHKKALKITGAGDETYISERFLARYFEWQKANGSESKYTVDNTGKYTVAVADTGGDY